MSLPEPEAPLAETIHEAAKESKAAMFFVLIMATVQLISVAVFTYNAIQDRKEEEIQQSLNRKLKILQDVYHRKDNKYKEIDYAVITLKATINDIQMVCNDKGNLSPDQKKEKLNQLIDRQLHGEYILLQAFGAAKIVFNEELFNKVKEFLTSIENTETYNHAQLCANVAKLSEEKMHAQVNEIDSLMHASLADTESRMDTVILRETGERID